MSINRRAAVVICGGALLVASAPTVASGVDKATSVFVTNGDDQPVPTKAVGTTSVSGSVGVPDGVTVNGKPTVSVPDGVTVNGKPTVSVPDGVTVNGPVAVQSAAPQRFNVRLGAQSTSGSGEVCTAVDSPAGKRVIVEVVHFEAEAGAVADSYVRQVTDTGISGFLFDRFRPEPTAGNGGRLEGPFIDEGTNSQLAICAREATRVAAVVVGFLEDL